MDTCGGLEKYPQGYAVMHVDLEPHAHVLLEAVIGLSRFGGAAKFAHRIVDKRRSSKPHTNHVNGD